MLSVPGVEVLPVGSGWDAVDGLQQAESRGHRSVAVTGWSVGSSIQPLSDYAASRRAAAATDIWVVWSETDMLSDWQQELSDDARYQRLQQPRITLQPRMATGGNEQTASPLAEFGSFSVKDSAVNSTIHLCRVRDDSDEAWEDKVRAIRADLAWDNGTTPSRLPGVEVLRVNDGWDAVVGGLQQAESDGHRSVAMGGGWGAIGDSSIKPLSDHVTSRRAKAAADIWVLNNDMYWLSMYQRELSDDARYQRLMLLR
jgi:hypothetical protein